jgi:NADH-quinone oxidoreductase subunit H
MSSGNFLYDIFYNTDTLLAGLYADAHSGWTQAGIPSFILDAIFGIAISLLVAIFIVVNALFIIWFERKIAARIQIRRGPNRVGPFGIFQTIADTVKLLLKEDITPRKADKAVFGLAPVMVLVTAFMIFLVIPFGKGLIPADIDIGLVYFLAVGGIAVIAILAGGWSSNNKYSLMGGLRSAAQIVSYEVPSVLSVIAVAMLAGSLRISTVVDAQPAFGFIIMQPVGFLLFLVASSAEINRAPFDLPEADSELVSGFITEYSGIRFAYFFLAEYTNLFLAGALATALFLGGWHGPFLPPIVWFLIKSYIVVFVLMWIRWTFPRLRVDQVMAFSWKVLVPIALINLVVTAFLVKLM